MKLNQTTWIIIVVVLIISAYLIGQSSNNSFRDSNAKNINLQQADQQLTPEISALMTDIDLQKKCADRAVLFFKQGGYEDNSQGFSNFYINHWNKKLGKCFIQINSTNIQDDFLIIDIFDAFEGKHYAEFDGHNNCSPLFLSIVSPPNPNKCQLDSGNVWLDGDDTKNPSDFHFGFGGLINGGIGDENTQKDFIEKVRIFMFN